MGAIQALAPSVGVELRPVGVGDASEIERAVTAFAQAANNGGLIVTASAPAIKHRDLIIALATRHRLPAVYSARFFVTGGGLISDGPDGIEPYRQAAGYVDRILKAKSPATCRCRGRRIRAGDQPQSCKGARPHSAADAARPRRRGHRMRRREFITTALGGAAAWPIAARAQQPATPVIGFCNRLAELWAARLRAFRKALSESGYDEGRNLTIEYRWAHGQYDRLATLAADLVQRQVTVIVANGPATMAAKAATTAIPIVFFVGFDPVKLGLVASLNWPGGNLTGVSNLSAKLAPKRLALLHELVPKATIIALLVNPTNPNAETPSRDAQAAAGARGLTLHVLHANSERDFDTAFATLLQQRVGALVIGTDEFFVAQSQRLAALTVRHGCRRFSRPTSSRPPAA